MSALEGMFCVKKKKNGMLRTEYIRDVGNVWYINSLTLYYVISWYGLEMEL